MIDYDLLHHVFAGTGLEGWTRSLKPEIEARLDNARFGDLPRWQAAVAALPEVTASEFDLCAAAVRIGSAEDCSGEQRIELERALRVLHPWRKGPFDLFGIRIDTEWRSDLKWERLLPHVRPHEGRRILDVGCGNGYHCWRMAGAGAEFVLGIDPSPLYFQQFLAIQRYAARPSVTMLPVALEDLPGHNRAFDSVYSMGVLYHRRSPVDHLVSLRGCLRQGGQLVLETLVVEGDANHVLTPADRYARMRNVWFVPSCLALKRWLERCGFEDIRCVDVTPTSTDEQRSTDWMSFESLADSLDPEDPGRTVEGLPAPTRAIFTAVSR